MLLRGVIQAYGIAEPSSVPRRNLRGTGSRCGTINRLLVIWPFASVACKPTKPLCVPYERRNAQDVLLLCSPPSGARVVSYILSTRLSLLTFPHPAE